MILVDSSVWIDYFNGVATAQTSKLEELLDVEPLAIGDLNLTEVLQGFGKDRDFERARDVLTSLEVVEIGGMDIALRAAQHCRSLRKMGITVRKTIDSLIATRCIEGGYRLLHNDRDFAPFEQYLGLQPVIPSTPPPSRADL